MNNLYAQRDFGEKINAIFLYISQHFRSLLVSLLYIVGPVALATGIATSVMQANILRISSTMQNDPGNVYAGLQVVSQFFSPAFWLSMLFGVLTNVAVILVTYAHIHRSETSLPVTPADIWADMQPQIGRMLVYTLLMPIITTIGFFFFFIPGLYVGVVLALGFAITYFEKLSFGEVWNRCFALIRDNWWSTFGYFVVMVLIIAILGMVFAIPAGIFGFLSGGRLLPGDGLPVWVIITNVVALVGRSVINSVIYLAVAFQYGNLVEQQEGRSLYSAINTIGTSPTKPRATDDGDY